MKLILITTPTYFVEEDKILTTLFEEGLDILHLRKPNEAAMYAERLFSLIPEKYHKRIVIHDHFYMKNEYRLKGIHLSERNPFVPEDYSGFISATCHTIEDVLADKKNCDYVFLSNIFNSISYPEQLSSHTPEEIRVAAKSGIIDKKVIALGGVTHENILQVKDFGFGWAAIQGAIWSQFNHETANSYKGIIEYFKRLKRIAD